MSAEQNKSIVRRWVEAAWNNGDFSSAASLYPASYVHHPSGLPDQNGPDGITQFIGMYRRGMPDLRLTVDDLVAEGDKVTWRFTARGTMTGELFGFAPTDKIAATTGTVFSRFEDGQWVEDYSVYDALTLLQQLGIIPMPA